MIKSILTLILLVTVAFVSCTNSQKVTKREGRPDIVTIEQDDQDMNAAIVKANQTIGEFNRALSNKDTSIHEVYLKARFKTSNGGEHIWLGDVRFKDGSFYGVVINEPEETTEVKPGDTVKIQNDQISDWMYLSKCGRLNGGYTIRVLRDRMPEAEKKQFDRECGFVVED